MGFSNSKYEINKVEDFTKPKKSNSIRILLLSDTHTKHSQLEINKIQDLDIVLHAGDFTYQGKKEEVTAFLEWYKSLKAKYKIFIAGNHELTLDLNHPKGNKEIKELLLNEKELIYLENKSVNILGLNIFGSPYSTEFNNWAFPTPSNADKFYQENIKKDTDIILIHGPPYNILDKTLDGIITGCKPLLNITKKIKPGLVVFGHIHETYGIQKTKDSLYINASVVNFNYKLVNKPIVLDFIKKN